MRRLAMADKLQKYRDKRDLNVTPEPSGGKARKGKEPVFVIQKHDARALHYDFRLEVDGVLASWAVPKGPSTDPKVRRLAMRTEDHPMDYVDFEGVIPEGNYGAGTVIVWDRGTYRNLMGEKKDALSTAESIDAGHVEVWLNGDKLRGGFTLIRTQKEPREQWLLIKMKDTEADARRNPVSTEAESVLSGKTIDQVREEGSDGH